MSFERSSPSTRCGTRPATPSDPAAPAGRLARTPGVQRVPSRELELFLVRGFLEPETCRELIARIDQRRRPSEISDDQGMKMRRGTKYVLTKWFRERGPG